MNREAAIYVFLWLFTGGTALRDIQLSVPEAVSRGDTAVLGCKWALDAGETLYSVKWYHSRQEFFRYIPKELPHTRVFSQPGIDVDISRSGAQQVVLRQVPRSIGGKFRCEVSADAPYFHTIFKTSNMHVVDLPESAPLISSEKSWYSVGDILRANCTAPPADPKSNLTWFINGNEVKSDPLLEMEQYAQQFDYGANMLRKNNTTDKSKQQQIDDANNIIFSPWKTLPNFDEAITEIDSPIQQTTKTYTPNDLMSAAVENRGEKEKEIDIEKMIYKSIDMSNRQGSSSQLILQVQHDNFRKGRLKLTCVSSIYSIYSAQTELMIEEVRPQIASVLGTRDSSGGQDMKNIPELCLGSVLLAVLHGIIRSNR